MSSLSVVGISGRTSVTLTHALKRKLDAQPRSDNTQTVFIIHEDAVERGSLELFVDRNRWQAQTFSSVQELLSHPAPIVPCCLIVHLRQNCNGLELQSRLAAERPEMPIIFITPYSDLRTAVEAIKAGAIDFLTTPLVEDQLLSGIRQALQRSRVAVFRQLEMRGLKECYATLTTREREVMALVVSGMLNKQVGGELGISEITVKAHRGKVMQKMKADSLAHLVKMAGKLRLPASSILLSHSPFGLSSHAVA